MMFGAGLVGRFGPREFQRIVELAEHLGFSHLWVADEGLFRNVYACLAVASLVSSKILLGTAVTNPYTRHPALTAAAIATIDELSEGRAILGLGAGGSATAVLGLERLQPVEAVRDAIAIINALTQEGRVDYRGKHLEFRGALDFKPIRRVPVFLGARGPRMLQLAGELADGVIIGAIASLPGIRAALRHVSVGAEKARRNLAGLQIVSWLITSVSSDYELALDAVGRIVAVSIINSRYSLGELGIMLPGKLKGVLDRHDWARTETCIEAVKGALTEDVVATFSLIGSADSFIGKIRELGQIGITQVATLFLPPKGISVQEQMELFADSVIRRMQQKPP